MARKDANPGKNEREADRRIKAFELRKTGMEYRAIGAELGVSHATIFNDIKKVLEERRKLYREAADDYVEMQKVQLQAMLQNIWDKIQAGEIQAIYAGLAIMERQAKLLGLDAPIRQELSTNSNAPLQIEVVYVNMPPKQLALGGAAGKEDIHGELAD